MLYLLTFAAGAICGALAVSWLAGATACGFVAAMPAQEEVLQAALQPAAEEDKDSYW